MRNAGARLNLWKSVTLLLVLCVTSGCGSERIGPPPPKLYPVEGKVTFDKVPVAEGYITFDDPKKAMPSAGASIKDGVYKTSVAEGQKRVSITAVKVLEVVDNPMMKTKDRKTEQFLPEKFNTKSELTAEVSTTKKNELNFDLTAN